MEIISKISKGSKMDQVYIPKNRLGMNVGSYVVIKLLQNTDTIQKANTSQEVIFYDVKSIEPIKLEIINKIFKIIDESTDNYNNIIITGSFLERGFSFNDVDVLIISDEKVNQKTIENLINQKIGINAQIIILNKNEMIKGLETDPLYNLMISRCIAKKRFIYKIKQIINYKILDLHLLKSKILIDNFDILSGGEKFKLTRNMIAISLFLDNKKITNESINKNIEKELYITSENIKQNMIDEKSFIKRYDSFYNKTFNKILEGVKNGSKQK